MLRLQKVTSQQDLQHYQEQLRFHGFLNFLEVPSGFDYLSFLRAFGELLPQYDGQIVWPIKAEQRYEQVYHSRNTKSLTPHTECYEFPGLPPKYLALWCVKAPSCGGGQTTLADGYQFLSSLCLEEKHLLSSRSYHFQASDGIRMSGHHLAASHPLYDPFTFVAEPIFRFSANCLVDGGDTFIQGIRERCVAFFEGACQPVSYQQNSLLIWDNWRMLHARTAFTDATRHLNRVWIAKTL